MLRKLVLTFVIALYSFYLYSQSYQIGSIVKDFKLIDVSGKMVAMSDYSAAKGFIIVFTSNACPFSKLYEQRLNKLSLQYQNSGFHLIAINANDPSVQPEDSYEVMKMKVAEKQLSFPYLFDENQKVTSLFNPLKTPHAFILVKENQNFKMVYSGAIDDSASDPSKVKVRFIENAIEELLMGKKLSVPVSKPIGCTVKWKKT